MTVFQNKNLVKVFLEKKNQGRKKVGKFRLRQKMLRHRNRNSKFGRNFRQIPKLTETVKS